ncbi:MAG: hypothetical protein ACJAQ6_000773 [Arenicella sp.]|jgi:hypothetical protein
MISIIHLNILRLSLYNPFKLTVLNTLSIIGRHFKGVANTIALVRLIEIEVVLAETRYSGNLNCAILKKAVANLQCLMPSFLRIFCF